MQSNSKSKPPQVLNTKSASKDQSERENTRSPIKLIEEGDKDYSKLKIGTEKM